MRRTSCFEILNLKWDFVILQDDVTVKAEEQLLLFNVPQLICILWNARQWESLNIFRKPKVSCKNADCSTSTSRTLNRLDGKFRFSMANLLTEDSRSQKTRHCQFQAYERGISSIWTTFSWPSFLSTKRGGDSRISTHMDSSLSARVSNRFSLYELTCHCAFLKDLEDVVHVEDMRCDHSGSCTMKSQLVDGQTDASVESGRLCNQHSAPTPPRPHSCHAGAFHFFSPSARRLEHVSTCWNSRQVPAPSNNHSPVLLALESCQCSLKTYWR